MSRYFAAAALVCLFAVPARAQDDLLQRCASAPFPQQYENNVRQEVKDQFHFMCAQVVNAFTNVQPSVGVAFSGGNPVLGTATTLGTRLGFVPRVSATARANIAFAKLPDLFGAYSGRIDDNSGSLEAMETLGTPIAAIQGDVTVGLFNGVGFGPLVGGVGAVDLLGSLAVVPRARDMALEDAIMNVGVGARVGLLKQGLVTPGVSVTAMYRRMGEVAFGDTDAGDPGQFSSNLRTLSVRGVASKGVAMFDVAVGGGYDQYTSDLGLGWVLTCGTQRCRNANGGQDLKLPGAIEGELSTAAWNVFGDLALSLLMVNVVGEIGYQKPMDPIGVEDLRDASLPEQSMNVDDLGGGRFFGSLGVRFSL